MTRDDQAQVRYSMAGRSGGRVTPCAVYTVHIETRSAGFMVEPQNQGRRFVSGLTSKPLGQFLLVWCQNRWLKFSSLGLKTSNSDLVICASKSSDGFLVCASKLSGLRFIDCATTPSRSSGTLCVEASEARVSQFGSKLVEVQRQMVHVASSRRSRGVKDKDKRINVVDFVGSFYSKIIVFVMLGLKSIVVFYLGI
jgi:hypothetical protein